MEDSFSVRVDRAFGCLSTSSTSQPLSSSVWCLTDEEIEKREWNRDNDTGDDDDDLSFPSNVDGFFSKEKTPIADEGCSDSTDYHEELENDLKQLDNGDDVEGNGRELLRGGFPSSRQGGEPDDYDEDEWDVKNSIGMDCTLDFEEEEDEHDKVAVGREKAGDRLYMHDVADYVPHVNSHNGLPSTFGKATRDPRANHLAAKLRLKEDTEAAGNFNSLRVSDATVASAPVAQTNVTSEDEDSLPKSILKRKENQMDTKSEKRVRFDPGCKSGEEARRDHDVAMKEINTFEVAISMPQNSTEVPDYIRNPSMYTHYTFDSSSDMDDESNPQACMDFLNLLEKSKQSEPEEAAADLSKPIIFKPKKKDGEVLSAAKTSIETEQNKVILMGEHTERRNFAISFASGDTEEDEASAMEGDEPETEANKGKNCKK
ncbi:hypothetical protein Ancab_003331 [Ancistrocladus abbreviatus]